MTTEQKYNAKLVCEAMRLSLIEQTPMYKTKVTSVTKHSFRPNEYYFSVQHHNTTLADVFVCDDDGVGIVVWTYLYNSGYYTKTTKRRLDDVMLVTQFGGVFQYQHQWYVTDIEGNKFEFYNGMHINSIFPVHEHHLSVLKPYIHKIVKRDKYVDSLLNNNSNS